MPSAISFSVDAFEAIIGAVYSDGGHEAAMEVLVGFVDILAKKFSQEGNSGATDGSSSPNSFQPH